MPDFNPNTKFSITGDNLNFINNVKFGPEFVTDLQYIDTTGLSGTVPIDAYTSEITASTSHGVFSLGTGNIILTSNDQVEVGKLHTLSGKAGDVINITGENFSQITNVKFGDVEAEFQEVDSATIEAVVPKDADYTGVTIFSSLRTGLNNDQTIASGKSVDEFIPIPEVSGISSAQLCSGEEFSITGFSFSGVSGVKFGNNDNLIEAATLSLNTITTTIPSGNIRSGVSLMIQSGQEVSLSDSFAVSPLARVTGIQNSNVGISTSHPAGSTGQLMFISGENFVSGILYPTGDLYLGTVMGETGEFKLISHNLMSGMIPTGIPITASGGNLGAGILPTISSGVVNLFSDNFPEAYPSTTFFTPSIGLPKISSITPSSGIVGDVVSIKGNDLYSITGVNFLPSANANVGIGTYDAGTIAEVIPGFEASFEIGNAASLGTKGEYYDVVLSGSFGSVTGVSGFFSLGTPVIATVDPSGIVSPGSSGLVSGNRLYSGTTVELWTGGSTMGSYEYFQNLDTSGYNSTTHDTVEFTYPNSFFTGVPNYKIRTRNRRGLSALTSAPIGSPLKVPTISGFNPLSGEFGDTVTVSGYFENIVESGLNLGELNVGLFNQTSTTGFNFIIPNNSQSDTISINTSGGQAVSTGILQISPSKPAISGFYTGIAAPEVIDYTQVFKVNDILTISGERLNLVTGIRFSGESDAFTVSNFSNQQYSTISTNVPPVNPASGNFKILDFLGRETESSEISETGIIMVSVSGFDNYLLPAENLTVSGYNISGMDVLFPLATGGATGVSPIASGLSDGMDTLTVQVPTGIIYGNLQVTGRSNNVLLENNDYFFPVGVVTGISGIDDNRQTATGSFLNLTGINVFDPQLVSEVDNSLGSPSGVPMVGFSGQITAGTLPEGVSFSSGEAIKGFEVDSYETGLAEIGGVADTFYSRLKIPVGTNTVASGNFFVINPWWTESPQEETRSYVSQILGVLPGGNSSRFYHMYNFPSPQLTGLNEQSNIIGKQIVSSASSAALTGEQPFVSGFSPIRGAAGTKVLLSGSGLNFINSIDFINVQSNQLTPCSFTGVSTVLEMTIPEVERQFLGDNQIVLNGPSIPIVACNTGYTISGERTGSYISGGSSLNTFEYLIAAEAIDNQVVPSGLEEPQPESDRTVNYTVEETRNGVVWLITKTKFPDGSVLIVSSIPKSYS